MRNIRNIVAARLFLCLFLLTSFSIAEDLVKNQFLIKLYPGSVENRVIGLDGKWELGISDIDDLGDYYSVKTIKKLFPDELNNEYALWYKVLFDNETDQIESILDEFGDLSIVESTKLVYKGTGELLQWGQYPVDDPYYNTEIPNWNNTYNRDFEEWWLFNDGDPIRDGYNYPSQYNSSATVGMDISIEEAWNLQEGRDDVIIAIWDTGIAYQHEDIRDKMWVNRFEDANGDGQFNIVIINRDTGLEDPEGHLHQLRWNYCEGMFTTPNDLYFDGDRGDASCDWAPGLFGVDDDGDGFVDFNDPGVYYGILTDGEDSDNDGTYEDEPGRLLDDSPGIVGVDDDGDGIIDDYDGAIFDDDENGYIDDVHGYYFDFVSPSRPTLRWDVYYPQEAHGSSMAGRAAANTNNSKGIAGVCKNCVVMAIGHPFLSIDLDKQLKYAMDNGWQSTPSGQTIKRNGVNVINMSWAAGVASYNTLFEEAFYDSNIVLIGAAGNGLDPYVVEPANLTSVLAVAGLEPDGKRADLSDNGDPGTGSNIGDNVEICGPYAPIAMLNPVDDEEPVCCGEGPGPYFRWNTRMSWYYSNWVGGTSGAAATVSGVAGLIISELYDNGIYNYSAQMVRDIINSSGVNVDALNPSLQGLLGEGMVNANNALSLIESPPSTPTNLTLTNSNGHPRLQWSANTEPDMQGYKIYRNLNGPGGTYQLHTTINDPNTTSYTDTYITIGNIRFDPLVCYKLKAFDIINNLSNYSNSRCTPYLPSKIAFNDSRLIPDSYNLKYNTPNPFNPITSIRYDLPEESRVVIKIYDLMGREVNTLVNGTETAGFKNILWNSKDSNGRLVSSGMYLYRLDAVSKESDNEFHETRKMVLLQ